MNTYLLVAVGMFVAGWVVTNIVTPRVARFGRRWDILDQPGKRKVHEDPTPRTGGLAIFVSLAVIIVVGVVALEALRGPVLKQIGLFAALAVGATMIFAVGLYDDVAGAGIWTRFGVETAAALVVIYGGGLAIQTIYIPLWGQWELGVVAIPLTVVWIVGVTNALNIIDGLDGLAGGIAFIACFGVFAVATLNGQPMAMVSTALLAGCTLGFLRYNSHPATIFLGDSGALLLGFLLACISVDTSLKRSTSLALILPMQMLAVPLLDTLYSMFRRLVAAVLKREDMSWSAFLAMFRSDKDHIHHRLLKVGFSHPRAVWLLYALSFVAVAFGLVSALFQNDRVSLLFLVAALAAFLVIRHFGDSLPFIRRWSSVEEEDQDERTTPSGSLDPRETPPDPHSSVE